MPAGSLFSGIIARTATINTDETLYAAQLATDGHVNLYRRNAYTWTLLAANADAITAGVQYTVKLVVRGSNPVHLEVWLNGAQRINFDDSSAGRITAGRPGSRTTTAASSTTRSASIRDATASRRARRTWWPGENRGSSSRCARGRHRS